MPARCTLQFIRWCYGLRGIYGRFDSKIRFEIKSDSRFDSRFDSNAKKQFAGPYDLVNFGKHEINRLSRHLREQSRAGRVPTMCCT